jgi:ferric-dicitrate binding protein FerR (iron transport regulator)
MSTGPESDPMVEALLRQTGRRPAVPAERARRVEDAVRTHWRSELQQRSRIRRRWSLLALATAATMVAAIGLGLRDRRTPSPAGVPAAVVEIVVDAAWHQPETAGASTAALPLRPGQRIGVGAELATESNGLLALRLSTGHSLRMDAGSRLRMLSAQVLELARGAVYVDSVGPGGPAAIPIEIRTPLGSVREIGTQFEVRRRGDSWHVRVREGKVSLQAKSSALEVRAGHELELSEDGASVQLHDLSPTGTHWLWLAPVTPPLQIEGRTAREFLEWIARERGMELHFASAELAQAADRTRLSGSIAGMSLEEALDSVLPTCRMSHRAGEDQLWIEPLRSARS